MPWTKATIDIDADKVGTGSSEAGTVTVVFDYGDGTTFSFTRRADRAGLPAFIAAARAALTQNDTMRARRSNHEANLLAALNGG